MNFTEKAFITGFVGDLGLQIIANKRGDIAGLKEYFEQHGGLESSFIASSMMYGFANLYERLGFDKNNINLFVYGASLDIMFRQFKIMKSLNNTYYKNTTPIQSAVWGGIPFLIAFNIKI
jgi:hypothetical protein